MSAGAAAGQQSHASSTAMRRIVFIFITLLIDMMALGLIMPILPKLVASFVHDDASASAEVFGVFGTAWALMQLFSAPVLGMVSDRFGRRPVVLLSNLGLGLDYILMALAPSLAWLFVGRVISGITSTPKHFRSQPLALSRLISPGAGKTRGGVRQGGCRVRRWLHSRPGGRRPAWRSGSAVAVLGCGAARSRQFPLYRFFVLPESLPPERRAPFQWSRANPLGALRLLGSTSRLMVHAGDR